MTTVICWCVCRTRSTLLQRVIERSHVLQELATVALSAFVCEYYRQSDGHPKPQAQGNLNTCICCVSCGILIMPTCALCLCEKGLTFIQDNLALYTFEATSLDKVKVIIDRTSKTFQLEYLKDLSSRVANNLTWYRCLLLLQKASSPSTWHDRYVYCCYRKPHRQVLDMTDTFTVVTESLIAKYLTWHRCLLLIQKAS